jgi:hypothetical protein
MLNFKYTNDIFTSFEVTGVEHFIFEGREYSLIHSNKNVKRGFYNNLSCITFRNEEERHNISIFYQRKNIKYVETGYSFN